MNYTGDADVNVVPDSITLETERIKLSLGSNHIVRPEHSQQLNIKLIVHGRSETLTNPVIASSANEIFKLGKQNVSTLGSYRRFTGEILLRRRISRRRCNSRVPISGEKGEIFHRSICGQRSKL